MTGHDVRQWREAQGLTQAELAAELDLQLNTIWRWESGNRPIPHPRMVALALEALGRRRAEAPDTPETVAAKARGVRSLVDQMLTLPTDP